LLPVGNAALLDIVFFQLYLLPLGIVFSYSNNDDPRVGSSKV
jgi:hypothetical protein